mgnify:CR=1 FL=1
MWFVESERDHIGQIAVYADEQGLSKRSLKDALKDLGLAA